MIFRVAFNIVGFGMLIGCLYFGARLLLLGFDIRGRNMHLVGKGWNGRVTSKQLRKLKEIINDEKSKQAIEKFLKYHRLVIIIIITGVFLFLLIGFLNRIITGGEN
jgi:hypothetical protein